MPEHRLTDLLSGLTPSTIDADCLVSAITLDSRNVKQGSLFLACSGGDQHGMDYIE